jgi:hypothetical protein
VIWTVFLVQSLGDLERFFAADVGDLKRIFWRGVWVIWNTFFFSGAERG